MKTFLKRLRCDIPLMTVQNLDFLISNVPSAVDIQAAESEFRKQLRAYLAPKVEMKGNVAIVPVQGTLAYNPDVWEMFDGVEDSRSVASMIHEAASNPEASGILLRMDTPGGMVLGGPEIADAVSQAKSQKPVVAHIGGMGASLGYMIASQASEIVANRSAIVGSIGVIASVTDYSEMLKTHGIKIEYLTNADAKYKGTGAFGSTMTDDQRQQMQSQVESAFSMFKSIVLSARPQVKPEAMQGQTFRGSEAKSMGLVDRIGDENFAMSVLRQKMKK